MVAFHRVREGSTQMYHPFLPSWIDNAGKQRQPPGNSACNRGRSGGRACCTPCVPGHSGRTTIPAAAACSFLAFSRSCLSPKRHAPADGQIVNPGIIFGLFSPCALRSGNGWCCGMGKSLRRVLCAFGRGICPVSVTESYRTVHKIFRTNRLHISPDSDIIKMNQITKGGTRSCRLLRRN